MELLKCVYVFKFQTPLNEALRYGFRNIVELLLKKGASLNMSEKSEDGTEVFPMDIAQKDVALLGRGGQLRNFWGGLCKCFCRPRVWQYWLWSFRGRDTKLERLLAKS